VLTWTYVCPCVRVERPGRWLQHIFSLKCRQSLFSLMVLGILPIVPDVLFHFPSGSSALLTTAFMVLVICAHPLFSVLNSLTEMHLSP
jgi:membrane-associated phospholipid phosphatase